jgi:hypothetical protein
MSQDATITRLCYARALYERWKIVLSVPRANETSRSMLLDNVEAPNPVPFWYTYGCNNRRKRDVIQA